MELRRRQISIALVTAALIAVVIPAAFAIAPRAFASDTPSSPTATASVVKVENRKAPRNKVVHRKFRPWAHPTPGQVREIISSEARRWRVPAASLSRRVACESRYHWWATNGQYVGVLQMGANAFYRGLSTIRSYKFRIVHTKTRVAHDARVTHYSDGRVTRRKTTPRRQRVRIVLSGRISRRPSMANAFAQIRIGAQALRGISAVHSSEWSCGA
jgi:hypothetical protein